MKFRTEINIPPLPYSIDYRSKIFGMGSCFVDHIKTKLAYYRFQHLINPFGTIFNPYSIRILLQKIANETFFTEKDLFQHENLWKSFDLHTGFNRTDKDDFLNNSNRQITTAQHFLQTADWAFFTFGTAWVYQHKLSGKIVNNCHKVPQKEFDKLLLSPTEIKDSLVQIAETVKAVNPMIKIVFSISPVRHLKDGFVENQRSKARLVEAVHSLINDTDIFYFPSYEIMMDDLRDYRFYKPDLIHPNEMAVDYIWKKFQNVLINPDILPDMKTVAKIQKQLHHKSFIENIQNQQVTLQKNIKELQKKYPFMRFEI